MAYEVLARKWRPQQFEDVVGQDHVTQTLKNAIETERLAHAYLFVGPRGIGKTSLARILSKALNCEKGPTVKPCDKCESCREIMAGNNLDVLEIDGASNNGVDQVRDLRETVKYLPVHGKHKIYVIDEVHMLSTAAFNALLKTLEEPPPHVMFIFATTEPDKILATIVSRCQRFDLRRIPLGLIIERLRLIVKDEKVKIDEDALLAIARGAEGGLRDAESSLDQLISFKGKKIVEEDVLSVFGLVSRGMLERVVGSILAGDMKGIIRAVGELDAAGKDVQRLVIELMEYFRNILVFLQVGDSTEGSDMLDFQAEALKEYGAMTNTGRVIRVLEILSEAQSRMKYALSKRTLLETALIRCARAATVVTLEEILGKINALREGAPAVQPGAALSPETQPEPAEAVREKVVAQNSKPSYTATSEAGDADAGDEAGALRRDWGEIVSRVSRIAPLARASLVDSTPLSVTREKVLVGCDPGFAEDIRSLGNSRNHAAVERVIGDFLRRKVNVEFVESEDSSFRPAAREDDSGIDREDSAKEPDTREAGDEDGAVRSSSGKSVHEWAKKPVVKESLDLFDGYIAEVRE